MKCHCDEVKELRHALKAANANCEQLTDGLAAAEAEVTKLRDECSQLRAGSKLYKARFYLLKKVLIDEFGLYPNQFEALLNEED